MERMPFPHDKVPGFYGQDDMTVPFFFCFLIPLNHLSLLSHCSFTWSSLHQMLKNIQTLASHNLDRQRSSHLPTLSPTLSLQMPQEWARRRHWLSMNQMCCTMVSHIISSHLCFILFVDQLYRTSFWQN